MSAASPARTGNIPSLDGLRATAIAIVILSHTPRLPVGASLPSYIGPLGALGVRIFFVISGFLITTLLLRELDRTGRVDLRAFYIRRTFRIFPPYYAFLLLAWIAVATHHVAIENIRFWPAWTYTSNFFSTDAWVIGHSWSLSVEEQFYLFWPLALSVAGRDRGWRIAIAMAVVAPLIRCVLYLATRSGWPAAYFNFDFLAAGCCLAFFWPRLVAMPFWTRRWAWLPVLAATSAVLVLHLAVPSPSIAELVIVQPFEAVVLSVVVAWCVARPQSVAGRILNLRPLAFVGVLSYSIYLWQQIFFRPGVKWSLGSALAGTLVAAASSYFLVERPALALRNRVIRWRMDIAARSATEAPVGAGD